MNIISKILQAILEAALPVIASACAAWLVGKCVEIFRKLKYKNPELYEILKATCGTAVNAAEQIYIGSKRGEEKKAYAINVVEKYLAAKGINLDVDVIVAYIEAAVRDMNTTYELVEVEELEDK